MIELINYEESIIELVKQFYKKYYFDEVSEENFEEDFNYYVTIDIDERGLHYINISDDYIDLNDMYIALINEIPKKTFHDWYNYQLDWHMEEKK